MDPAEPPPPAPCSNANEMSVRILLVEDDPRISAFLLRGLAEEGFVVELAETGPMASLALRDSSWDLVLLDWWLPGTDGLQVLQLFRERNRTTPVLFLTARDAVDDRVTGLDAGADDYLCKPFSFNELLARIRALLRRGSQSTGTKLTFEDVEIDLATQAVSRAGARLELTAKEYALLVYFVRHPGHVLSRTRIYDHVWQEAFDGVSNTLEVHVKELRQKLERYGPRLIQTLRGRGYRLGTTDDAAGGAK